MSNGLQGVSISWLAEAFGKDRRTVSKKLKEANISPCGKQGRFDLYAVADAAPLLCTAVSDDWENINPDQLPPLEQQQYWNAQKAKVQTSQEQDKLKLKRQLLLEYDNVEFGVAALLRRLREGMLVAGDLIEAEAGLSNKQRAALDEQIDTILLDISNAVSRLFGGESEEDDSDL